MTWCRVIAAFLALAWPASSWEVGEVKPGAGRRYVAVYHEEMPIWVADYLRTIPRSWASIRDEEELDEIVWQVIHRDPVAFVECFFVNRSEEGGGVRRLLPHQRESLRYRGHVIHKDAAGVGKTWEILSLLGYTLINTTGSVLVVSNSQRTESEIYRALMFQLEKGHPFLSEQIPTSAITKQPLEVQGPNDNRALFAITGHDGESIRSIHIGGDTAELDQFLDGHHLAGGLLLGDEAAKWKNEQIWKEFFRAAERNTRVRIYSVPDGDRTCKFHRIAERAVPYEDAVLMAAEDDFDADVRWTRFHWTKPMMGPPFWTAKRKAQLIEQYEGEETPGYQQNVLGLDGDPEGVVFPWGLLRHCLRRVSDYRVLRIVYDLENLVVRTAVDVGAIGPEPLRRIHQAEHRIRRRDDGGAAAGGFVGFDVVAFVRDHLPAVAVDVIGTDHGRNEDPTEILAFEALAPRGLRLVGRIHMRYAPTSEQRRVMAAIEGAGEDLAGGPVFARPRRGWGIEASGGSHGQAVFDELLAHGVSPARVTPYDWRKSFPLVDPRTGEALKDDDGHQLKSGGKELATRYLEAWVADGLLHLHDDPDLRREWSSHSAREGATGRIFAKRHDHTIEATRAAALALVERREPAYGAGAAGGVTRAGKGGPLRRKRGRT